VLIVKSLFPNPAVAGPVIAASGALAVFSAGEFFTRRRVAQQYRWDKIAPTYKDFVSLMRKLAKRAASRLQIFLSSWANSVTSCCCGSPEVIEAWSECNAASSRNKAQALAQRPEY